MNTCSASKGLMRATFKAKHLKNTESPHRGKQRSGKTPESRKAAKPLEETQKKAEIRFKKTEGEDSPEVVIIIKATKSTELVTKSPVFMLLRSRKQRIKFFTMNYR